MANLTASDPKVIELSYDLLEKIIMAIDYKSKEDLVKLSSIMLEKVNSDDKYPELLKLAYADAKNIPQINAKVNIKYKLIFTLLYTITPPFKYYTQNRVKNQTKYGCF